MDIELVFVGDQLEVRDDDALKKLNRDRWSASSAKSISNCPSRWAMDRLLPREEDPLGPAEIGTSAHKALELLYGLPADQRTSESLLNILSDLETHSDVPSPDDPAIMSKWRGMVTDKAMGDLEIEDPTTIKVLHNELKLKTVVGGVPMIGFVDRLTDLGGGLVSPDDYKSGRYKGPGKFDDHSDQIRLYAAALGNEGYNVEQGELIYIGARRKRTVKIKPAEVNRVVDTFVSTFEQMQASAQRGSYETKAGPLCGWCPLATVCPAAAKAGKSTPKVPSATLGTSLGIRVLTSPESTVDTGTKRKEATVETKWSTTEDTPWVAYINNELNPNGGAATGFCGNASLAFELVVSGDHGLPSSDIPGAIRAMSQTIESLVRACYADATGSTDYVPGSGLSIRIRGILRSCLEFTPLPWGEGTEAWDKWANRMRARIGLILDNAMKLSTDPIEERPWKVLP